MLGLMQYPQGLGLFSHTTNMWQISNLQIDSSVIQIVQSDVLRNSVDTKAAITNRDDVRKFVKTVAQIVDDRRRPTGTVEVERDVA